MKTSHLLLAAILLGVNPLSAQTDEPESFSEAELYKGLSWGMSETEARRLAKFMSDAPADASTLPADGSQGYAVDGRIYSEDLLLLLSLVSEETNRKVEQCLVQMHLGKQLAPDERATWEKRRAKLRSQLIRAGKLQE